VSVLGGLAQATAALPYSDLSVFGEALGALVGGALRVRRAHVERSMERAGVAAPAEAARGMYRALGTSALELLWLAGEKRDPSALVRFDATAREALGDARRRGAVIAASHTGNWDLAACAVASRAPLLVVTKHLSVRFVDAFWQRARAGYGVSLAPAAGAFARGMRHVASGGAVAMMIDQVPMRRAHAVQAPFLGQTAWVDRAPAALAARSGAPLIVSAARRDDRGVQEIHALDVIAPPARAGREWIDAATVRATAALERFVLQNPTEWLWMHRRWKPPPA
jgi:KDO2-lipid IV(A) lauroyltransferase